MLPCFGLHSPTPSATCRNPGKPLPFPLTGPTAAALSLPLALSLSLSGGSWRFGRTPPRARTGCGWTRKTWPPPCARAWPLGEARLRDWFRLEEETSDAVGRVIKYTKSRSPYHLITPVSAVHIGLEFHLEIGAPWCVCIWMRRGGEGEVRSVTRITPSTYPTIQPANQRMSQQRSEYASEWVWVSGCVSLLAVAVASRTEQVGFRLGSCTHVPPLLSFPL